MYYNNIKEYEYERNVSEYITDKCLIYKMLHIFFDCIIIHTDSRFVLNNVLINTKTQILETAKSLFLEFGFENTSMLQITKRANVSKGGFYHYFACKEDLLHAILDNYVDHLYIQAKEIFEDPNMDPIEKIRLWVKTQNAFVQPKEAMFQKAFCNENFITLRYCLLKKIRQGIYPLLESNIRI